MKIVIAMDSFKGSLTSLEAGKSVKKGILEVFPHADISLLPLADGGEGTLEVMNFIQNGKIRKVEVKDALLRPISAEYGIFNENTAFIEVAKVIGLPLLKNEEKKPLITSSYGIGEMIKDAFLQGVEHFYVGLGGSSTNDGGFGMLRALGYRFLTFDEQEILTLEELSSMAFIDDQAVNQELRKKDFTILSDVKNPLLGKNGCSFVFGAQKGASKAEQAYLDAILAQFSKIVTLKYDTHFYEQEGAGAAGGLGFAFLAFFNAKIELGSEWVLAQLHLEQEIMDADYVITGEGKIDQQTLMGKGPGAVASLAKKYQKKVLGFGGTIEESLLHQMTSFDELYPIIDHPFCAMDLIKDVAKRNIERAVKKVFLQKKKK